MNTCPRCRRGYEDGVRFCPLDGAAIPQVAPAGADPYLGKVLMGQFELISLAGRGAMGTVYRARQANMDRTVAVKVLRRDLLEDKAAVSRFLREARAAARLSHPNIVTVHLVGQTDEGVPFLAMEFVDGPSLGQLCEKEMVLEPRRALRIGRQIASALSDAHSHGIVHRDLKPENILLASRGRSSDSVKVLDFGIAKMIQGEHWQVSGITRDGTIFGTPHYIAPEQASGQEVDARADLYSLGVILFRMTTGRLPFEGTSGMQVLMRHVREPPPRPRSIRPDIPEVIESLILRALEKDRGERWQDAEEMGAALDNAETTLDDDPGRTIHGVPPVSVDRQAVAPTRPARRDPTPAVRVLALPPSDDEQLESGDDGDGDDGEDGEDGSFNTDGDPRVTGPSASVTANGNLAAVASETGRYDSAPYAAPQPSRMTLWVVLGALVMGGGIGLFYAIRGSSDGAIVTVDGGQARAAQPDLGMPAAPFEDHIVADGNYTVRAGFTAPPQAGARVGLLVKLNDKQGSVQGARLELSLKDRAGRDEPLVLRELGDAWFADVSFRGGGRHKLRVFADARGGGRVRAVFDVDVMGAEAETAATPTPPSTTPRKPRPSSSSSSNTEDKVDPANLPVTLIPATSSPTAPRPLGPAPDARPIPTPAPRPISVAPAPAPAPTPAPAPDNSDPYKILENR